MTKNLKIFLFTIVFILILLIFTANNTTLKSFIKNNFFQKKKIKQLSNQINYLENQNKNLNKILKRYKADNIYAINKFALSHDIKFKTELRDLDFNVLKKKNIKSNNQTINGSIEVFSSNQP